MLRQSPRNASLLAILLVTCLVAAQSKPVAVAGKNDISGMYTFLQDGEFVQINVERGEDSLVGKPVATNPPVARATTMPDGSASGASAAVRYDAPALEKSGGPFPTPGRVTGFVSRFGDTEGDKGVFLDHFFTKGTLYGNELFFTTKTVHGVFFEFKGKVERVAGKAAAEEGYFVIKGTLKRIAVDANSKKTTSQSRDVVMKSFPDIDTDSDRDPGN